MSEKTKIEWTRGADGTPGSTWNPVRGCTRVSRGCEHCWAERMAARNLPGLMDSGGYSYAINTPSGPRWTGRVELIKSALEIPLHWKKPRRIFVNSMSDTFHEALPDADIWDIFSMMLAADWHIYLILTKRAERMMDFCRQHHKSIAQHAEGYPWPKHIWLGVSVEDRPNKDRIQFLRETPAALRFLSLEPLLEDLGELDLRGIGWVIGGGESGPGARPCDVSWIRSVVRQCRAAGVPAFVKQLGAFPIVAACRQNHFDWGEEIGKTARFSATDKLYPSTGAWRIHLKDRKGGDWSEWAEELRVRQMPGQSEMSFEEDEENER